MRRVSNFLQKKKLQNNFVKKIIYKDIQFLLEKLHDE